MTIKKEKAAVNIYLFLQYKIIIIFCFQKNNINNNKTKKINSLLELFYASS